MRLLAAVVGVLLLAVSASASLPGRNGRIAFSSDLGGGQGITPITALIAVTLAGKSRPLGAGMQPAPSPDGKMIAVVVPVEDSDTIVALIDAAGRRRDLPCAEDPAWSPDSKHLACRTGASELVVVDAASGKLVRTLAPEAASPAWSPDGRWIAFLDLAPSRWNLVVIGPDGSGKKVVARDAFSTPSWSPDSTKLAVSSRRGSDNPDLPGSIFVAELAGGAPRELPIGSDDIADEPRFSPDGSKIAYYGGPDVRGDALAYSVYVVGADGTGTRTIGPGQQPRWSPDGAQLAYLSRDGREIFVAAAAGGSARVVAHAGESNVDLAGYAWFDSQTLLYATSISIVDSEIYTSAPNGSAARALTANGTDDREPAWSPDGTRIAWIYEGARDSELWVMNANGGRQHRVATASVENRSRPAWSPDGRRIVFTMQTRDRSGNYHVVIAAVASSGGRVQQLTKLNDDLGPAWSPDGRSILFVRRASDVGGVLYSIRPDGTGLRRVGGGGRGDSPDFSPDGRRIAYTRYGACTNRSCVVTLWVMQSDGTRVRKLATGFAEPAWSPDGRLIYGNGGVRINAGGGRVTRAPALKYASSVSWQRLRR